MDFYANVMNHLILSTLPIGLLACKLPVAKFQAFIANSTACAPLEIRNANALNKRMRQSDNSI